MSKDIRQLTKGGKQFYPQTHIAGLVGYGENGKAIDDEPNAGSDNLVKSGGVQNELALGAVYDVSAKNPTAGPNNDGKWESFSALLSDANLNTLIPTVYRKGGMSIKFVQSSDNKYVQYRLMSDTFNTTPSNWQGVDDEPTAGSENLVKSGGVFKKSVILAYMNSSYHVVLTPNNGYECILAKVKAGEKYYLLIDTNAITESGRRRITFLSDLIEDDDQYKNTVGHTDANRPEVFTELTVPDGANYMAIQTVFNGNGNTAGYRVYTEEEYYLYHKVTLGDDNKVDVSKVQSFSSQQKAQGLSNLGISGIDSESILGSEKLIQSGGVFTIGLMGGYLTNTYDFLLSSISDNNAIVKKVKAGEKYHIVIDAGSITVSGRRRVAFYNAWSVNEGIVKNAAGYTSLDRENHWYEITIPEGANYMVVQTKVTPSGGTGTGNPSGYHIYTDDEYNLSKKFLKGKHIYWFGSSIDEGYGQYPYSDKYGWTTPLERDFGAVCENQSVSGASIRDLTSIGKDCIVTHLIDYINGLSANSQIDYIIWGGGGNDRDNSSKWGTVDPNTFVDYPNNDMNYTVSALENLCSWLQSNEYLKKKGTKYGMVVRYTVNDVPDNPGWEPSHWNELADRIIQTLNKWGIPYIDLRKCGGITLCSDNARSLWATDLVLKDYDESAGYEVHDTCKYNNKAYRTNQNIPAPAGAFNSTQWEEIPNATFYSEYDENAGYYADQRCYHDNKVYKAYQAISAPAGEWDESKWELISDNNGYDRGHINRDAYDHTATIIANWIKTL